ncbi:MAG: hypothetical protein A2W31_00195 [Planctomycetes bacterium RBG_16_64_10]|nr:MAG: hypothetical protein A2W31_00195 [Planctomycetes bacterium RBG_16_64_10]
MAPVQIANSIGGKVGHVHFKHVAVSTQQPSWDRQSVGMHDQNAQIGAIDAHTSDVLHVAEVYVGRRCLIQDW